MTLLTRAADKMLELIVPRATVSASTVQLYCGCIDGVKWYRDCERFPNSGVLKCGGCNVKSSTKC